MVAGLFRWPRTVRYAQGDGLAAGGEARGVCLVGLVPFESGEEAGRSLPRFGSASGAKYDQACYRLIPERDSQGPPAATAETAPTI